MTTLCFHSPGSDSFVLILRFQVPSIHERVLSFFQIFQNLSSKWQTPVRFSFALWFRWKSKTLITNSSSVALTWLLRGYCSGGSFPLFEVCRYWRLIDFISMSASVNMALSLIITHPHMSPKRRAGLLYSTLINSSPPHGTSLLPFLPRNKSES